MQELNIKFTQVLDVPWERQLFSFCCGKAYASGAIDFDHPKRAIPGGGEFIQPDPGQDPLQDVVPGLQRSWPDVALAVAAELLLIPCCSQGRAAPGFIDEHHVLRPQLFLHRLIIGTNAGASVH